MNIQNKYIFFDDGSIQKYLWLIFSSKEYVAFVNPSKEYVAYLASGEKISPDKCSEICEGIENQLIFYARDKYFVYNIDEKKYILENYFHINVNSIRVNNSFIRNYLVTKKFKNKKFVGLYSSEGKEIIPIEYDEIKAEEIGYIVGLNGEQGFFDFEGKEILPIKFNKIKVYAGMIVGSKKSEDNGEKKGLFSCKGLEILPVEFKYIEFYLGRIDAFTFQGNRIIIYYGIGNQLIIWDGTKTEVYSENMKKVIGGFDNIEVLKYIGIEEKLILNYLVTKKFKNKKFVGLYSPEGKEIIPIEYDEIKGEEVGYIVELNGKQGFFDFDGNQILSTDFSTIEYYYGMLRVSIKDDENSLYKYEIFDLNGVKILPIKYRLIYVHQNMIIAEYFVDEISYCDLYKLDGTLIFNQSCVSYNAIKDTLFILVKVKCGDKFYYGIIDNSGNILIPAQYEYIKAKNKCFLFYNFVGENKKIVAAINFDQESILPYCENGYDNIIFHEKYIIAEVKGQIWIIDYFGNVLSKPVKISIQV